MRVKPQHSDIKVNLLNHLEDDKHIYKAYHNSQKQINTNRLININQKPERLKQKTVKKYLHKAKYTSNEIHSNEKQTDKNKKYNGRLRYKTNN